MNLYTKNMHYILNTDIQIPKENSRPPIGGPTIPSQQNRRVVKNVNRRKLKPGIMYTLTYIKKNDIGVEYTFKSDAGEAIVENFKNCDEADMFIAGLKNESIPNYGDFYSKLKS
jgi:hypothetical protein